MNANLFSRKIEMTKTEAKAAGKPNTTEYNTLLELIYCDQQAHVEDVKDCDTFIRGFRLGARMILDVVGEYDSPMVQINELMSTEQ